MNHAARLAATAAATAAVTAVGALVLTAPVSAQGQGAVVTTAAGPLTPFENITSNPAAGGWAKVHAVQTPSGRTVVTLHVQGLVGKRAYGAHVHEKACSDAQGGMHYMNDHSAGASPQNEVWLDFMTNPAGRGNAQSTVQWTFRPGEANSVVVHDKTTDAAGRAGAKLACIDVTF